MQSAHFHGSYHADDVVFLLKPIDLPYTDLATKERLIQSGARHYSEMLSPEYQPSASYLSVFHAAFARNRERFARDALALAARLAERDDLVLVSLARAGTPVGVLLKRILRQVFGREVAHYTLSIIRDRGIDGNALRHILSRHGGRGENLVFIDGWTGKGVIARELARWVGEFNRDHGTALPTGLWVIADICGQAEVAASQDDYLIPSALLNSTVSGLVSRSILNRDYLEAADFHGCKYHRELQPHDLSLWYIEQLMAAVHRLDPARLPACVSPAQRQQRRCDSENFLRQVMADYRVDDLNRVKPGLGEAIRVLLRRVPDRVLVRDRAAPEIEPFLVLAAEKNVAVEERPDMPYLATGVIDRVSD